MSQSTVLEPGLRALRCGAYSLLLPTRPLWSAFGLAVTLLLAFCIALLAGSTWLSPAQLLTALTGDGTGGTALLIEFRLPRVLVAVLGGAALGMAGCLIQALMRNRLASPDLLGVADGATFAVLLALMASPTGMLGPWWVGPLGAIAAVTLLVGAAGRLGTRGQRVLVVGLGLSSLLRALTELALSRENLMHANALYSWSIGNLAGRSIESVWPLAATLTLLLPLAAFNARRLALLRFDSEVAATLGLPVRRTQWQALAMAVLLAGVAVGVCGPIAFVALAAPVLAERLAGGGRIAPIGAALAGASLVVLADTVGRTTLATAELPAGVICNLLGGPFLLWLLLSDNSAKED
ncbi:FecCD family ABC transporter permease [Chitinimonas lacunae]|uniref:FecCD family ABC transporter permease n=1 Tax=Chitinimonas lacunae TaxID=1963018 RepID=A0ABV8MPA3_9NEIS